MDIKFERGIDRITHTRQNETALPATTRLLPTDSASTAELDKLLARPNLRDYVFAALRPQIADKALLTPAGFQQALHDASALLQRSAAVAANPTEAAALERGWHQLGEQTDLRLLLTLYRNALFQG
ncbi:type III secretion apparatus assembly protein SctX [Rugamonas aquatica]|nr:hypothetical protein [Rugamonas aquatica]